MGATQRPVVAEELLEFPKPITLSYFAPCDVTDTAIGLNDQARLQMTTVLSSTCRLGRRLLRRGSTSGFGINLEVANLSLPD